MFGSLIDTIPRAVPLEQSTIYARVSMCRKATRNFLKGHSVHVHIRIYILGVVKFCPVTRLQLSFII